MAKGEQRGNRETKKPKKEKIKTIAAAPSQKAAGWQPSFGIRQKEIRVPWRSTWMGFDWLRKYDSMSPPKRKMR